PTPTTQAPSDVAAGCSAERPGDVVAGQTVVRTMESGATERSYRLYVPASIADGQAVALVMNWHGRGSNALEQELYSALAPVSEREGFILVMPEGINGQFLTNPGVDDVQFARDLVRVLASEFCTDPARVFSTGMSNGAFMSTQLACQAADLVAAVAPSAGATPADGGSCPTAVPILVFAGVDDAVVPYGPDGLILGVLPYIGMEAAVQTWAESNGCEGSADSAVGEAVALREFSGCEATTRMYIVEGGGHTWPGAIDIPGLGPTTHEISATELIWEFFAAHSGEE
ncbi:MAG: PHB depolymerase family esterase, partial [Dehalococcoidia bacterium]